MVKPGVLKRVWLVFSVLWTVFISLALWINGNPNDGPVAILTILALPWILGPIIFWIIRFIAYGVLR